MLKGLVRTGVSVGFAYGVYSFARKFWGKEIDAAIEAAVTASKEKGRDLMNKNPEVKESVSELERSVRSLGETATKKADELKAPVNEVKHAAQHVSATIAKSPELKAPLQDLAHKVG